MTENTQLKLKEIDDAFIKAKNLKDKISVFKANFYFLDSQDTSKTLMYLDKMILLAKTNNDDKTEHVLYIYKFNYYRNQGEYDKALQYALKSKVYFFNKEEKALYYVVLSDISVVLFDLGLLRQAIFLWKEIFIYSNASEDDTLKYMVLNNLTYASLMLYKKFENTEKYINEMLSYYEKNDLKNHIIYCKSNANMGVYLMVYKKNFKEAKHFLEISLQKAIELKEINAQFELYMLMSECCEALDDDKNKIYYLKKAKDVFSDKKRLIKAIPVYNELYKYYKSKDDFKNALKYHEMSLTLELYKNDQQKEINKMLNNIGFNLKDNTGDLFLEEYTKKHIFDFNREIFLENIKGLLVKINIDSVIFVESSAKMIKIHFVDKTSFIFKASMKEFSDLIVEKFSNDHLFFNTNLRSEMVNLFWMSKFDKLNKKLYLNVLGEEMCFEVTRTQVNSLKDFLRL